MVIELTGNWKKGFAYDLHTLGSSYIGLNEYGYNDWKTTRSEMGELVYRLKYKRDKSSVTKIVDLLLETFETFDGIDAIIPIPPSKKRFLRPVYRIAVELGKRINIPVFDDVLNKKTDGKEQKNIDDPAERKKLLEEQMTLLSKYNLDGKNILLIDDLYRSGSTLCVATNILYQQANVKDVFVLTMTKTRSKT